MMGSRQGLILVQEPAGEHDEAADVQRGSHAIIMVQDNTVSMEAHTADYLEAVNHLPPGSKLTLYDIRWDEYEQLLAQLGNSGAFRTNYDYGRLEIMSPSARHERYKSLLHDLVMILSDELGQEIISYGSTTLKIESKRKGAEGDDCFYVGRSGDIGERNAIDLTSDPPPDLVVEIDLTSESLGKFAIYAALGVPEIWRYDGRHWQIWQLSGQEYEPVLFSLAFPFLSARQVAEFVEKSEAQGHLQGRRGFRDWVRANQPA